MLLETGWNYHSKGRWDGESLDGSVVFSCVDNMEVRKKAFKSMTSGMFIEVRMGVRHGMVFAVDTALDEDRKFWEDNWYSDDVVEEKSACGTSLTIGSTANLLSSLAMWQLIRHMNEQNTPRQLIASVEPYTLMEVA